MIAFLLTNLKSSTTFFIKFGDEMKNRVHVNDWAILRARYSSNNEYKRRIALSTSNFDDFSNWLVDIGADVISDPEQNEILRFRLDGVLGIWYQSGSGNLLMHDLAVKFKEQW